MILGQRFKGVDRDHIGTRADTHRERQTERDRDRQRERERERQSEGEVVGFEIHKGPAVLERSLCMSYMLAFRLYRGCWGGGSSLLLHLEFRGVSQDSGKIFETMPLLPSCSPMTLLFSASWCPFWRGRLNNQMLLRNPLRKHLAPIL